MCIRDRSGNAGVLVSSLDTYLNYHNNSEPWEHQALIKARVVGGSGSSEWFQQVKDVIHKAVYEWNPPSDLNFHINHLRQRKEKELSRESKDQRNIKEGRGGLLDIEYLTQALQLKHGRLCPQLQNPKTMKHCVHWAEIQSLNSRNQRFCKKIIYFSG